MPKFWMSKFRDEKAGVYVLKGTMFSSVCFSKFGNFLNSAQ
jgi:hypothetical protein